jgi:hypothetical protein
MDISVPLSRFATYLKEVKANPRHPHLGEIAWLVENFKFDDTTATYAPKDLMPRHITLTAGQVGYLFSQLQVLR